MSDASQKRWRARRKQRLLDLLGNRCARCGFNDPRALQVDHVNGRPVEEHPQAKSNQGLYAMILAGKLPKKDFQILCANCNWIKRAENGEVGRYRTYAPDPDDWPKKDLWAD